MSKLRSLWRLLTGADMREAQRQHDRTLERMRRQVEIAPYYAYLLENLDANHEWPDELKELFPGLHSEHEAILARRSHE